jgi:hypothetical protein
MLIIGAENYAIIDSNNNVKNWNLFEYQYSYQRRPHCSDDLVVFFGDRIDSEIEIRYKKYWSIDKSSAFIDFRQVDSTFLNFASSRYTNYYDYACVNNLGQLLIPYISQDKNSQKYLLLDFIKGAPPGSGQLGSALAISDTLIIEISDYADDVFVSSCNNNFITTMRNTVALIYPDGNFKILNDFSTVYPPTNIFKYNNKLYAVCYYYLYESKDNGETWSLKYESGTNISKYIYQIIDDRIIVFHNDYIGELAFTDNGFIINEIQNDGLESNEITSLIEYNDKIYATTLSGLFYRDKDKFFEYKEDTIDNN